MKEKPFIRPNYGTPQETTPPCLSLQGYNIYKRVISNSVLIVLQGCVYTFVVCQASPPSRVVITGSSTLSAAVVTAPMCKL